MVGDHPDLNIESLTIQPGNIRPGGLLLPQDQHNDDDDDDEEDQATADVDTGCEQHAAGVPIGVVWQTGI